MYDRSTFLKWCVESQIDQVGSSLDRVECIPNTTDPVAVFLFRKAAPDANAEEIVAELHRHEHAIPITIRVEQPPKTRTRNTRETYAIKLRFNYSSL